MFIPQPCAQRAHRHPPTEQHSTIVGSMYSTEIHILKNVHSPTLFASCLSLPVVFSCFVRSGLFSLYFEICNCPLRSFCFMSFLVMPSYSLPCLILSCFLLLCLGILKDKTYLATKKMISMTLRTEKLVKRTIVPLTRPRAASSGCQIGFN